MIQTAQRSSGLVPSESVVYHRCLFAYVAATPYINGNVAELGSGEGYGIKFLAPRASRYTALDKYEPKVALPENVFYRKAFFPELGDVDSDSFDIAISFQVIEHIKNDDLFLKEIYRILKPNGTLILTTPNRLMSLTRNPWHVREYTGEELQEKLEKIFENVELKGVFGNEKVEEYYNKNKESVQKITKFDILDLQHRLPRKLLQMPYDIMNRINRNKLYKQTNTTNISEKDYFVDTYSEKALDIFIKATKQTINF